MARIGLPASVSVRPMPTNVLHHHGNNVSCSSCPSNIISSPTVIRYNNQHRTRPGGISSRLCRCCSCIHIEFMKRTPGFLKMTEAILGIICQYLLLEFGSNYSVKLGECYTEFLISVSTCLITTVLLLACYLVSRKTFQLIRSSIFETAFNLLACILYLSSSTYLAFGVNTRLYLEYLIIPFFQVYPALTAAYILGFFNGIVHGVDAFFAYRFLQTGR